VITNNQIFLLVCIKFLICILQILLYIYLEYNLFCLKKLIYSNIKVLVDFFKREGDENEYYTNIRIYGV